MQLEEKLWLNYFPISRGFNAKQIEQLCDLYSCRLQIELENSRHFPFKFWQSKVNGYGTAWRNCLNFKKFTPLAISADHGLAFASELSKFEYDAHGPHVVYDLDRYLALVGKYGSERIIRTKNPFIHYADTHLIKLKKHAKGTLVFVPHSLKDYDHSDYNWDDYIEKILSLSEAYHPITFCVHYHDVVKGLHNELLDRGLNVVSLGNTSSHYFIDRFYDLVTNFEFATSSDGGSDLFYCEYLGIKYFLYGKALTTNYKSKVVTADNSSDELVQKFRFEKALHFKFPPSQSEEKKFFVMKVLGLDGKYCTSYEELKKINRKSNFNDPRALIKLYLRYAFIWLKRKSILWFG